MQKELLKEERKTEFMAEKAVKESLSNPNWSKRTFGEIKKRLGGFEDNELRKILVRVGAVSFKGKKGEELWGLIEENRSGR